MRRAASCLNFMNSEPLHGAREMSVNKGVKMPLELRFKAELPFSLPTAFMVDNATEMPVFFLSVLDRQDPCLRLGI